MTIEKRSPDPQKDIIRTNEDVRDYALTELSKDKIESKGVDWQKKIDSVLETFRDKKDVSELNVQDMEQAEKIIQGPPPIPAVEFLKRSPDDLRALFLDENNTVNFYGNESVMGFVGAGDLFPRDQQFLKIDGVVGKRSLSSRRGKVGYLDRSGDYLPIYGREGRGEKIDTDVSKEEQEGFESFQMLSLEDEARAKEAFQKDAEILGKEESELVQNGAERLKGEALLNDQAFSNKLDEVCSFLGIEKSLLVQIMRKESSLNTKARNPSGATGLIQFMPDTARDLGTTCAELRVMSGVRQLDYVQQYFGRYKEKINSPKDWYLAVFYPRAIEELDSFVIGSEQSDNYARLVADQNPAISKGKQYITKADVKQFIVS